MCVIVYVHAFVYMCVCVCVYCVCLHACMHLCERACFFPYATPLKRQNLQIVEGGCQPREENGSLVSDILYLLCE